MKNSLILFLLLLIGQPAISQNYPEIKVNPIKEKGKAKIYYRLKSDFVYFPNTNLIDWQNSLERLTVSEKYDPNKKYFIESCRMVDGKKNGEFSISLLKLKKLNAKEYGSYYYTAKDADVVTGNYLNNEYNGVINFLTFINLIPFTEEGFAYLSYENGKIVDQVLKYPNVIKHSGISFLPVIRFEAGVVKESFYIDNTAVTYKNFEEKNCSIMRYGSGEYISKNNFVGSSTKGLQCYSTVWDDLSKNHVLNGSYRVYQSNDKVFDTTTNLLVSLNFKYGIQDGIQMVKSPNFTSRKEYRCINGLIEGKLTGFKGDKIVFTEEYLNGKLHGISKTYFDDGKLALEANYKYGFLDGQCMMYFKDGKINIESSFSNGFFNEVSVFSDGLDFNTNWINYKGLSRIEAKLFTAESIPDFSMFKQLFEKINYYETDFNIIIASGGKISKASGHQLLYKLKFMSDEKYSYVKDQYSLLNNGKPMVTYLINNNKHDLEDVLWKDETGKVVLSGNKLLENENKAKEAKNNSIISCEWCSKKVRFGDAVITYGDPGSCFRYENGKKIGIYVGSSSGIYCCSRKCAAELENQRCISKGGSSE